jgi:hypothetical protein
MKIPSLTKHTINTQKAKVKLSNVLSKTRKRTSAIVKFWKHIGQIVRERIPVLSPLQELISWQGLISEVSIIKYSASRRWRVIIIITEWIFAFILIFYGDHIIKEATHNISNIIFHLKFPQHISIQTVILMIVMSIGTIWYYGMIKPWDFKQAIKEHKEEYDDN